MRTWFSVANMIALLCLAILLVITCKNISIYEEQYNESRLIATTEYAAEAAFMDSISISENQTTYDTMGVTLLTEETLRTFNDMMSISYNMARDESSDIAIEDSIGVMCLVGNDGYYITDTTETAPGIRRLVWSPKLPYAIELTRTNGMTHDTLGVTLSGEKWHLVSGDNHTYKTGWEYEDAVIRNITWLNPNDSNGESITLTRGFADSVVSSCLTNATAYRLSNGQFSIRADDSEYSVYIPAINTYTGINMIASPSLLVVINNAKYSWYKGYCSTMQGFKVVWKPKAVAYITDSGERKYCYEGQTAYITDVVVSSTKYASIEDAARAGYQPDIYVLMQPIGKNVY